MSSKSEGEWLGRAPLTFFRRVFWESHSADIFQVSLLDDFQRLTI